MITTKEGLREVFHHEAAHVCSWDEKAIMDRSGKHVLSRLEVKNGAEKENERRI
jgi:hypothetical protein